MLNTLLTILAATIAFGLLLGAVALVAKKMGWFRTEKTTTQLHALPEPLTAVEIVATGDSTAGSPRIRETSAPAWAARKISLNKDAITIGRSIECDVVLAEDAVSAAHCRVERVNAGAFRIVDLGSTNKTWLNGVKVKSAPLNNGDQIRVGATTFVFERTIGNA